MRKNSKVIDVHYHFLPDVPDDFIHLLTGEIEYGLKKRGESPDRETLNRLAKETLVDPEGTLALARDARLGVDATCVNITDFPLPGIDAEMVLKSNKAAADLAEADKAVFVDAALEGPEPFQVRPLEPSATISFSTHAFGPESVLAVCEDAYHRAPEALLVGVRGLWVRDVTVPFSWAPTPSHAAQSTVLSKAPAEGKTR